MTTPSSWHAYAARALEREQWRKPLPLWWDWQPWLHTYEAESNGRCIHCGFFGSLIHTPPEQRMSA